MFGKSKDDNDQLPSPVQQPEPRSNKIGGTGINQ